MKAQKILFFACERNIEQLGHSIRDRYGKNDNTFKQVQPKSFIDLDRDWIALENAISKYLGISLYELRDKSIDEFLEGQELYEKWVQEQKET